MHRPLAVAIALFALGCPPEGSEPAPSDRVSRSVTSAEGDIGVVVEGHNAFTWEVYGAVAAGEGENVFFSPFSLTTALGMTLAGAEGETWEELADLLRVDLDEAAWHGALGALLRDLNGDLGRGYTLHVANRLFGQEGYPWEEPFLAICEEDYDAPLEPWDFIADPEGGRDLVNDWVAEQTQDHIDELLPPGSVDEDTRLVLANAIYFLADWATQFDPEDTADRPFHRLDGSTVDVPMMRLDLEQVEEHGIEVGWTADAALARLPYQDDEVSLVLVVPHDLDGLPALEAGLDRETFEGWLGGVGPGEGIVSLPKLEISWASDLAGTLTALGAPPLFDSAAADLTGMADPPDGNLFVTGVFHEAFVRIDEEGTEAAAATGVVVGVEAAAPEVVADRPFLFVVRDDLTGAILFVGRVTDPSVEG